MPDPANPLPSLSASAVETDDSSVPWWRLLNRYHWFVFIVAALGWMFDCFDQQIFTMSRSITMRDLMPQSDSQTQLTYGTWATAIFIVGWATGGLIFGTLGDKWGRVKTLAVTILVYAACTGLSAVAQSWGYFATFRFLTGAGVGGEFAVGAALIAEVMPTRARPHALGMLQALSAIGNILAAMSLEFVVRPERLGWGWRGLYYIGAAPGLIAFFVLWRLREPDRYIQAKKAAAQSNTIAQFGRISDLFRQPRWRRNTLVGLGMAVAGQIGLWGVGFYTPELIDAALPTLEVQSRPKLEAIVQARSAQGYAAAVAALDPRERTKFVELVRRITPRQDLAQAGQALDHELSSKDKDELEHLLSRTITDGQKTGWKSFGGVLQQVAAFLGISCFTFMAAHWGRRLSFLIALLAAWASLVLTFATFHHPHQIWYLWPLLGFCTFAPFGGYAIYFPELFPTRLRTTGTSFCYNVGRYITAFGLFILGPLAGALQGLTSIPGFRLAAMILACSYFVGLIALLWAPETVNQPLPEDQLGISH